MKRRFKFLKVLNSPFKPFRLKFYLGKLAYGTPYFYPRKWRYLTEEEAIVEAHKAMTKASSVKKSFKEWVEFFKSHKKAVPKKIGFSSCSLGWKTKWSDTDFRFEWEPVYTFVFFKWQIAIGVKAIEPHFYWEAWLYYEHATDKNKSKVERIKDCIENFPRLFTTYHSDGRIEQIDYYTIILKKKYLHLCKPISN